MTVRLVAVELEDVRRFAGRWRVGPFAPGLNVLAAPNEAGKSTLLAAVQAAIFLAHRSTADEARTLRRDGGDHPGIALTLETDAGCVTIRKRLAGPSGRVELDAPSGRSFAGDAAEEEIRRLFGVAPIPGRREVPRGVWGALWVTQGGSFAQAELDDPAKATLKDALAAQVGVVTGGAGARRIRQRIADELATLQTATGRPTGGLKRALDAAEAAGRRRSALAARRVEVERLLGEVARLRDAIARRTAARAEEALGKELAAAARERAALEAAAERRRGADEAARQARRLVDAAAEAEQRRAEAIAAAARRAAEAASARSACEAAWARRDAAAIEADRARASLESAREARAGAEEAAARARALAELPDLAVASDEARKRAHDAADALEALARAAAAREASAVTAERLAAIDQAAATLAARHAAAEAAAPVLTVTVLPGAEVRLDGTALTRPETRRALVGPARIEIPGQAVIRLDPAPRDGRDPVADARATLDAALRAAGVADPEAAREAARRRAGAEQEAVRAASTLVGLVGAATAEAVAAAQGQAARLAAALAERLAALGLVAVPDAAEARAARLGADRSLEAARDAERRAEAALAPLAEAERLAREEAAAAEAALAAADREADEAAARLDDARAAEPDARLAERTAQARAELAAKEAARAALPETDPAALGFAAARVERLEGRLKTERDAARRDGEALARTEGELRALEGEGLDEAIAAAEGEEARARAEAAALEARRGALVLLRDTIEAAEREATERYLAPVTSRLAPWLDHLLPGARARLDDGFAVTSLARDGREEPFELLSAGTREQIAVLVRLAFADLLREQGRPAPVILDDALVFSDDARIERMFDILADAAERTQIVVLTCRTGLFSRLGGHALTIERVR